MEQILKKSTALIHAACNLTLTQRRIYNVLLYNAIPELGLVDVHEIPIETLCRELDFPSRNRRIIQDQLRALRRAEVEYNIFSKDNTVRKAWRNFGLLAEVGIEGNVCRYSYPPTMRQILRDPKIYGRLPLYIQNRFTTVYSMPVWEYLLEILDTTRQDESEHCILLEDYRYLLGLHLNNKYPVFKDLKKRAIQPVLEDLNKNSNLNVEASYLRKGRTINSILFRFSRKVIADDELDLTIKQKNLVERMMALGVRRSEVFRYVIEYDQDYLEGNIEVVERRVLGKTIKSPPAYLKKALEEDYRPKHADINKILKLTADNRPADVNTVQITKEEERARADHRHQHETFCRILKEKNEDEVAQMQSDFTRELKGAVRKVYETSGMASPMVQAEFMKYVLERHTECA